MDTSQLSQRLRESDAETAADAYGADVDRLITTAVHRGHRRVVLRRSLTAVAGVAVLSVAAGIGINLAGPGASLVVPAGSPSAVASPDPSSAASATSSPEVSSSSAPRASADPSRSSGPGAAKATSSPGGPVTAHQVGAVLQSVTPDTVGVSDVVFRTDEPAAYMTLTDADGSLQGGGWVEPGAVWAQFVCEDTTTTTCARRQVDGGTFYATHDLEKPTVSANYAFVRADGRVISYLQNTRPNADAPPTRTSLILTDDQVQTMLTSPEWDALAARCATTGSTC